jgi:hypothetical protein
MIQFHAFSYLYKVHSAVILNYNDFRISFNKELYSDVLRAVGTWPKVAVDPWINTIKTYLQFQLLLIC